MIQVEIFAPYEHADYLGNAINNWIKKKSQENPTGFKVVGMNISHAVVNSVMKKDLKHFYTGMVQYTEQ